MVHIEMRKVWADGGCEEEMVHRAHYRVRRKIPQV